MDHPLTPRLTTRQPAATTPTCGVGLPSIPGATCGDPAAWHIRWDSSRTPTATLTCQTHMDQYAAHHAWYARHPAGPACSSAKPTWHPGHCTTT